MTDETKAEIVRRFADGESFGVLAEAYGISRNTIAGIVHRYGAPRGCGPTRHNLHRSGGAGRHPGVDYEIVRSLRSQGLSSYKIARIVGCSQSNVFRILSLAA